MVTFKQLMSAATSSSLFTCSRAGSRDDGLIGENPSPARPPFRTRSSRGASRALARLPALDGWTRTAWLVEQPAAWSSLAAIAGEGCSSFAIRASPRRSTCYRKDF